MSPSRRQLPVCESGRWRGAGKGVRLARGRCAAGAACWASHGTRPDRLIIRSGLGRSNPVNGGLGDARPSRKRGWYAVASMLKNLGAPVGLYTLARRPDPWPGRDWRVLKEQADMFEFWGKAQPQGTGAAWHPLPLHGIDVAAVGDAILRAHHSLLQRLCRALALSDEEVVRVTRFLLSIHDIGKFAKKFQAKMPEHFPKCFDANPASVGTAFDHGAGGLRLFDADLDHLAMTDCDGNNLAWRLLVSAVTGHHGTPPVPDRIHLRSDFGRAGRHAARQFARQARDLAFADHGDLPAIDENRAALGSYLLAGLAVLSDWIGSNQRWFPYVEPQRDLHRYWAKALERASAAIADAGMLPAPVRERVAYRDLLTAGVAGELTATPMQEWAASVPLPDGPALFLVEDETGSGKTEAAVMLAHRLMRTGAGDGLYVALPTMATANAMFDRLAMTYRRLFADDADPSTMLAHGARDMHEGFREARLRGARRERGYSSAAAPDGSNMTASAACAEWIADDRRRAFLADVGIGTVDQALLAILPNRYQSLRLLGLVQRILILDEVHAYDAYMQREIERLLEFQGALGGSAIVLSATLPMRIRNRLADAFARGLSAGKSGEDIATAYPLATVRSRAGVTTHDVPGVADRARSLPLTFLREPAAALDRVERAARDGRAVLYVRNTVDDAMEAHMELERRGLAPDLFHARFALADRLATERRVMRTFGKESSEQERRGAVLVATQVVEQSLDLDFDILVSDLAPVDLLVQRAGRLWRHRRRYRAGRPEMFVVTPVPSADAGADWFPSVFPRAARVYPDHARLWLTARLLEDAGAIDSPGGLRSLVEGVYGDGVDTEVPEGLQDAYWAAEGRAGAEGGVASGNVLHLQAGYLWDGAAWDRDIRTPTRLDDEPSTVLRLGRLRQGRAVPYAEVAPSDPAWRAWRLSEVRVPARRLAGEALCPEDVRLVDAAKSEWGRFADDYSLVVLRESPTGELRGTAVGPRGDEVVVTYDKKRGLVWDE